MDMHNNLKKTKSFVREVAQSGSQVPIFLSTALR